MTALSQTFELTPAYRRYALGLFVIVQMSAVIDRQILAILLEPIKGEFNLSDAQMGALSGLAFVLFYATLGIPIATWADRGSRRNIMTIALTIWSAMTALCAIAGNFWSLLVFRIGVGVGEAGVNPSMTSMVSDFYAPHQRARAIATMGVGVSLAALIGFPLGGWIGDQYGWRMAFFALGAPGLVIAIIVRITLREPPRGFSEGRTAEDEVPGVLTVFRYVLRSPTVRHLMASGALLVFAFYGVSQWLPTFLRRSHDMTGSEVGMAVGLLIGLGGGVGTFLGGWLSDLAGRRDIRWTLWLSAIVFAAAVPFYFVTTLAASKWLALTAFIYPGMIAIFPSGPIGAALQGLVKLRMRSMVTAIFLLVTNLIGIGLGPLVIGMISDALTTRYGDESLRYALTLIPFFMLWSALHLVLAARTLRADLAHAQAN